ncbi:MAG TPA: DUF2238 domain-containing protein [Alphaproteobacteria bacterium]|jgi:putative membrane protein|nr:DUF2238 domain-containing protein [Alphaproteobacteria bacterium]
MITTATSPIKADFPRNRLLQTLAAAFAVYWIVMAIAPVYQFDWLLENLLVFAAVATFAATYRAFPFSDLSYILLAAFLALHTLGSHYTYAEVPFGYWLQDVFGSSRNDYDRLVHFSYGLLIAYPVREMLLRLAKVRGAWAYFIALSAIVAMSAMFEIIEWIIASIVNPDAAFAYLGTQGDAFDAVKDMALALVGAAAALAVTAAVSRTRRGRT